MFEGQYYNSDKISSLSILLLAVLHVKYYAFVMKITANHRKTNTAWSYLYEVSKIVQPEWSELPNMTAFRDRAFKEIIKIKWGHKDVP